MDNFDLKKYLAEGRLFEASIPSGWKKIDTSDEYEEEDKQGRLMGFEAPMNGVEGDEVDNIYIEQDEDEFEVHIMTAFNNPEYKGPFNSKEEALKVAIQKMEDLKKDWDKDLAEGKLHEEDLDLHPDYDKGGKYYSEEGAEAFRIQPFKKNDIKYTKHEANRMGKYIVGLEGEELKKFISDYMAAWEADKGDTPEGKTFK